MCNKEEWQPAAIDDKTDPKVVDIYKAYSDRVGALRTIAALTIPIVLFCLKVMIDAGSTNKAMTAFGAVLGAVTFMTAVFIRVKANNLVSDYEKIVSRQQREAFRLLPLDSLMPAERYFKRGTEKSEFWTFTVILCLLGGISSALTLLIAVLWL